jgi:hypothetical protein
VAVNYLGITADARENLSSEDYETLEWLVNAMGEDIDPFGSIACCDFCYDEFVALWPLARLREGGLEEQSMDLDSFYVRLDGFRVLHQRQNSTS